MKKAKQIDITKGKSINVTEESKFRTIRGDLLRYDEELNPIGYDKPTLTLIVAEDLDKFRRGIVRLTISEADRRTSYLLHLDGILSCIYSGYAKNLNDLRKPSFRQHAVRIKTFMRDMIEMIKKHLK